MQSISELRKTTFSLDSAVRPELLDNNDIELQIKLTDMHDLSDRAIDKANQILEEEPLSEEQAADALDNFELFLIHNYVIPPFGFAQFSDLVTNMIKNIDYLTDSQKKWLSLEVEVAVNYLKIREQEVQNVTISYWEELTLRLKDYGIEFPLYKLIIGIEIKRQLLLRISN